MRRPSTLGLVSIFVAVIMAIVAAGSPGRSTPADPSPVSAQAGLSTIYLAMITRRQDFARLPDVPTALPTDTPTATPTPTDTPEATSTPTDIPTATPTPTRACGTLARRVRVTRIDVAPASVVVKSGRGGWGSSNRPMMLSPLPDGSAKTAWTDDKGTIHVTTLNSEMDGLTSDVTVGKTEVRGFVAHADGAALLQGDGDAMWLRRVDNVGRPVFEKKLVGGVSQTVTGSKWIDDWGHEGRLVWSGERYGAYFGHTQYFGASSGKHQGDLLWLFDENGEKQTGGWDWGCSHSLDLRLAHNGTRFGPVCLSDAFPSEGFQFNHRTQIRSEPSGDGKGYSSAKLGSVVPVADGFMVSFASREGRASADIGMVHVSNDGAIGPVMWLTSAATDETAPHLADYGNDLLAGWNGGDNTYLARVTRDGRLVEGPVTVDVRFAAQDDWATLADGDVAWSHAWDDMTELKVVTVDLCDPN